MTGRPAHLEMRGALCDHSLDEGRSSRDRSRAVGQPAAGGRLLGGNLSVESPPGGGTLVRAVIPLG
jgi:hypothetical protein